MLDRLVAELLIPLAVWVCISSLDDAFLDLQFAWRWLRGGIRASIWTAPARAPTRLALLIPCWREEAVLEQMLERNSRSLGGPGRDI